MTSLFEKLRIIAKTLGEHYHVLGVEILSRTGICDEPIAKVKAHLNNENPSKARDLHVFYDAENIFVVIDTDFAAITISLEEGEPKLELMAI